MGVKDSAVTFQLKDLVLRSERIYNGAIPWIVISNYDKDGKPVEKGTSKEGNGSLYIYNEDGNLHHIEFYNQGKLVRTETK